MTSNITSCFGMVLISLSMLSSSAMAQSSNEPQKQVPHQAKRIPTEFFPLRMFHLPHSTEKTPPVRLAGLATSQENDPPTKNASPFNDRRARALDARHIPVPESIQRSVIDHRNRVEPKRGSRGEYIYDGNDRGRRITVDSEWNIHGLDTEDTIGHFDTLGGKRLVSPSNRVTIYAPRFSAVRQVSDFTQSNFTVGASSANQRMPLQLADGKDLASTTKQHLQLDRFSVRKRASGFIDQTRGLTAENLTVLAGARNRLAPYEQLAIIRFGKYSSAEGPRLSLGMQSANVWRDGLSLQVTADHISPVIVNDVYKVQQTESIETNDDNAILRVLKIASRLSGRPGDIIEFTIRFDNLSSRQVGNVTIVDNLTKRLEYVEGSAESTLKANFITEPNNEGSDILRWEITDPLDNGKGGVVKFKCRVR